MDFAVKILDYSDPNNTVLNEYLNVVAYKVSGS